MLTYLLAIGVGLASFALYMAAFFFPEIYRKYDLVWSGVGMFYALVLWVCADRITGGVLLGQMAGAALIGWFGWQTLALRWEQTPVNQRIQVAGADASLGEVIQLQSKRLWAYLQSEEFKSQLPETVDQVVGQASKLLNSGKEKLAAFFKAGLQSQSSFQTPSSSQPQPNSEGDRSQMSNVVTDGIDSTVVSHSKPLHSPLLDPEPTTFPTPGSSPTPDSSDHLPERP